MNPGEFPKEIDPTDLRIDTFKPRGAGGFGSNSDICVRITHLPSGLSAESCEERSQHANKAKAMNMLLQDFTKWCRSRGYTENIGGLDVVRTPDKVELNHAQIKQILSEHIQKVLDRGVNSLEVFENSGVIHVKATLEDRQNG